MDHRRKAGRRAPPSGVAGPSAPLPKVATTEARPNAAAWPHIQAVIEGGGQIMVGTVAPIRNAAVAHDGRKTLVMLRRQPREAIPELLARLDAAIATAQSTGSSRRRDQHRLRESPLRDLTRRCQCGLRVTLTNGLKRNPANLGSCNRLQFSDESY